MSTRARLVIELVEVGVCDCTRLLLFRTETAKPRRCGARASEIRTEGTKTLHSCNVCTDSGKSDSSAVGTPVRCRIRLIAHASTYIEHTAVASIC